ncbi:MAG: hypothetical protein ACK5EW_03970 [Bacteroidota bacterium]|jgi:hypothetical protein
MAQYKLTNSIPNNGEIFCVIRVDDGAAIPFDENNADYQGYLKWLDGYEFQITGPMQMDWVKTAESNTPLPADNV